MKDNQSWLYRGACHKFGDDLQHDGQMIAFDYVIRRITDPAELIAHLFETLRPRFHEQVRAGDILIAGKQFGKGKAHVQAYIAMKALGLAVACESMPYNTYRALIGTGFTFMTGCAGILELVDDGDDDPHRPRRVPRRDPGVGHPDQRGRVLPLGRRGT